MYNKQKPSLRIHAIKWFDSRNKPRPIRSFVWSQDLFQTAIFIFTSCHFPSWCYLTATKYSKPFWRNTDILQRDLWSSLSTKAKVAAIDSPRVWPMASTADQLPWNPPCRGIFPNTTLLPLFSHSFARYSTTQDIHLRPTSFLISAGLSFVE